MDLTSLNPISPSEIAGLRNQLMSTPSVEENADGSFKNILTQAIDNSENLDEGSNVDVLTMLSGQTDNLSDLLINAQKSELAVNLTVQIRNKAMDAYKEIMSMQV